MAVHIDSVKEERPLPGNPGEVIFRGSATAVVPAEGPGEVVLRMDVPIDTGAILSAQCTAYNEGIRYGEDSDNHSWGGEGSTIERLGREPALLEIYSGSTLFVIGIFDGPWSRGRADTVEEVAGSKQIGLHSCSVDFLLRFDGRLLKVHHEREVDIAWERVFTETGRRFIMHPVATYTVTVQYA